VYLVIFILCICCSVILSKWSLWLIKTILIYNRRWGQSKREVNLYFWQVLVGLKIDMYYLGLSDCPQLEEPCPMWSVWVAPPSWATPFLSKKRPSPGVYKRQYNRVPALSFLPEDSSLNLSYSSHKSTYPFTRCPELFLHLKTEHLLPSKARAKS